LTPPPRATPPSSRGTSCTGKALIKEAAAAYSKAREISRKFLDTFPDHFMAPTVHACMARCLGYLKQVDDQKAALQKMTLQYPDTYWASWAQAKLQGK
jgi:TolA-binding protein